MSGTPIAFRKQRGISLIGLILGFALIAIVGLLAAKIIPAFTEYRNILTAAQEAKRAGGSVANMQAAFSKQKQINDFEAVSQNDLVISKETGDYEISFAYEKRVPLVANASLLLEFEGTTAANAPAAAAADK